MFSRLSFIFCLDQDRLEKLWHPGQAINLGVQGKLQIGIF
jgi:hypothetical protein